MRRNLDQLIAYLQDYEHDHMADTGMLPLALEVRDHREKIKELEADIAELKEHCHHIHSEQGHNERGGTLGPIYPNKEPEEEGK